MIHFWRFIAPQVVVRLIRPGPQLLGTALLSEHGSLPNVYQPVRDHGPVLQSFAKARNNKPFSLSVYLLNTPYYPPL